MPTFNTLTPPAALYLGDSTLVFNAEALTTGEFSAQVALAPNWSSGSKGIRVEVDFNANPGTFELDVMESDADQNGAANYQQVPSAGQINTVTTGKNGASTHQSTDLIPVAGQFVLIYVKTQPSNASITATVRVTRAV